MRNSIFLLLFFRAATALAQADLAILITDRPDPVLAGNIIDYEITVTNNGPNPADAVTMTATFDLETPVQDIVAPGWACTTNAETLRCTISQLGAGQAPRIAVSARSVYRDGTALNGPFLRARASVTSSTIDPNSNNNGAFTETRVHVEADVRASMTGPSTARPGEPLEYVIVVSNAGPTVTAMVAVTVNLSDTTTIRSVPKGATDRDWSCSEGTARIVSCRYKHRLAAGASTAPLRIVAERTTPGTITASASVTEAYGTDPDGSNNGAGIVTEIAGSLVTTRFLVPLSMQPTPGAYGSLWTTELIIHNGTADSVTLSGGCCEAPLLVPGFATQRAPQVNMGTGYFLDAPANVSFNLRAQDLSRQALTWGTELPVVSEHEFRSHEFGSNTIHLLNVPIDARFRHTLRIYELSGIGDEFSVRFIRQQNNTLLATVRMIATPPTPFNTTSPGFAVLSQFPESVPALQGETEVRVEIKPWRNSTRFWAFIAITNNETQHVTTITPQ